MRKLTAWNIYQTIEYSGEQDQLKLYDFFLTLIKNSGLINNKTSDQFSSQNSLNKIKTNVERKHSIFSIGSDISESLLLENNDSANDYETLNKLSTSNKVVNKVFENDSDLNKSSNFNLKIAKKKSEI